MATVSCPCLPGTVVAYRNQERKTPMFRTLLVPLDGSDFAEQALPWALSIARRAGASLDLVRAHVMYAFKVPASSWVPFDPVMEDECRQEEQLYLDATSRWLSAVSRVPVSTSLVNGVETEGVLEWIEASKPDLVVMTTHGRGPLGRLLLGSTAAKVVRQTAAPVLLVRPRDRDRRCDLLPEPAPEQVLLPLDGSPLAEEALEPAAAVAQLFGAECTLLRVVEPSEAGGAGAAEQVRQAEAETYLARVAGRLREQGLRVQTRVAVADNAGVCILAEATALRSGLVALATHGRGGIARLVLGSVADKVVQAAGCPVLVYRPRAIVPAGSPSTASGAVT
jgi:nucleotide-binding universal stress UspA family protein